MPVNFCRPGHLRSQFNRQIEAEPQVETETDPNSQPTDGEEPQSVVEPQPPPIAIPANHKPAIDQAKGYCNGTYPKPLTAEDYAKQKAKGWLTAIKKEIDETIDDAKSIRDLPAKLGFSIAALSLVLITYSHIQVQSNEQQQRAISNHSEIWASNPDQTK